MKSSDRLFAYHVDLKRAMWRLDYLAGFVRRLKRWGFNAVVLEMEDKFRFSRHPAIVHSDAPTHEEWRTWARDCRRQGVDVIPLVQTLGHLEFALNRPEYAHLREAPGLVHHVDVTNPAARPFVLDLVREALEVFEPERFLHVGGDETWELAKSKRLKPWLNRRGELYLRHLLPVFAEVRRQGLRPMLWHDMVVSHPEILPRIPKDVVMVHWDYTIAALREKRIRVWGGRRPGSRERGNVAVRWGAEYRRGVTPEFRQFLEPFAVDAQTRKDGTFAAFYCTDAMKARGLEVITASANRCAGDQIGMPMFSRHVPNCYWSAWKGLREASGNLVTSWAVRHNHPETDLPATLAAVLAARGRPGDTVETSLAAWTESVFGAALPGFAEAARLAEQGVLPLGRAGQWRDRLDGLQQRGEDRLSQDVKDLVQSLGGPVKTRAFLARLRRGYTAARTCFRSARRRARRNRNLLDFWFEGVELQDFYAEFLQAALARDLPRRARNLHRRLQQLVAGTRALFSLTYTPRSVEDEILWRYGYHLEYLGRLLAERGLAPDRRRR
jgi:hypothetical protein